MKPEHELAFLELMASLTSQTPDKVTDPPPEPKPEVKVAEPVALDPSVETLLGIPVTAITDEGVTEDAVLVSPAEELTEEQREDLVWKAITADVPGLAKVPADPPAETFADKVKRFRAGL